MPESSAMHPSELDLQAYFDGELSRSQREGIAAHLVNCVRCSGELDRMAKLAAALDLMQETPAHVDVRARVLASLPARRRRGMGGLLLLQMAVAIIVLVVAIPPLLPGLPAPESWHRPLSMNDWGEAFSGLWDEFWQTLLSLALPQNLPKGLVGLQPWHPPRAGVLPWAIGLALAIAIWLRLNWALLSEVNQNGETMAGA